VGKRAAVEDRGGRMIEYTNEDCMVGMARYPDKYFDLAIVDPPYGIGINNNIGRRKGDKPSNYKKAYWDNESPSADYFEQLFRVSKNQIIWGANHFIESINKNTQCWLVWDKGFSEDVSFSSFEMAWTNFDSAAKRLLLSSAQLERIHPTQKPVALYKWLLKNYAKQGDRILDTHVGSASSLIACYDMGFDAVGFELDPDYYAASKRRLEDFMRQPKLTEMMTEEPEQMTLQITEGGTADAD
jgi:site-specific DNA-methyltransferase (adenine-specific)